MTDFPPSSAKGRPAGDSRRPSPVQAHGGAMMRDCAIGRMAERGLDEARADVAA